MNNIISNDIIHDSSDFRNRKIEIVQQILSHRQDELFKIDDLLMNIISKDELLYTSLRELHCMVNK
jgi:hypothetical protein